MDGLSSRLSAYSLSTDAAASGSAEGETADEADTALADDEKD
jgi:hypothetical protein